MEEEELYPLVAHWLRTQGYDPVIAGGQTQLSIPMVSLLPGKLFVEPDIVGLKDDSRLVAVEVKTDPKEVREALGQCLIYTVAADDVYLALTENLCREIRSLSSSIQCGLDCYVCEKPKQKSLLSSMGLTWKSDLPKIQETLDCRQDGGVSNKRLHRKSTTMLTLQDCVLNF